MADDLLASAGWSCAPAPRGLQAADVEALTWLPATVPGTAAGAVRAASGDEAALARDYDQDDWWWRVRFHAPSAGAHDLELDGLATLGEVWLDGVPVLSSQSMFARHRVRVEVGAGDHELLVCCRALAPLLRDHSPRARWRTRLVASQGLRRWRTTVWGRVPGWYGTAAPVGPWREVRLLPAAAARVVRSRLASTVDGTDGVLDVEVVVARAEPPRQVAVVVGGVRCAATVADDVPDAGRWRLTATVRVPDVELWWPHTHGPQPLYDAVLEVDGVPAQLGRVGFRTVVADRADGGFSLSLNGRAVFSRGVCWVPPDVLTLAAGRSDVERELRALRDAGLNTVRVTGTTTWQDLRFWDCCDELGLMVWQDCVLATLDPPDDEAFLATMAAEAREHLTDLAARPSLVVVSGGSETEQQPTFAGLARAELRIAVVDEVLPAVAAEVLPGVPFVTSTPTGGDLPTHVGTGIAHYFGVGAYLRPLDDLRRAGVRFAAECLAFSTPPERAAVEQWFGGASVAGHDPAWKRAVPRDPGASWDFEDVTHHYVRTVLGVDPVAVRRTDPERALDLSRAAVAHVVREAMTEWRRPGSRCAGALVLQSRDLAPGAGWGVLDAAGRPKCSWFALRDVLAPRALLVTDEGLDGLAVHLVNDRPEALSGRLVVRVLDRRGRTALDAEREVVVAAGQGRSWSLDGLLGVFRDVNHAYRFGPSQYEAVVVQLLPDDGAPALQRVHVVDPTMTAAAAETAGPGLRAHAVQAADGAWSLVVETERLARWVCVEPVGFEALDSWFHLAPGVPRTVPLRPIGGERAGGERPGGSVRCLGGTDVATIEVRP